MQCDSGASLGHYEIVGPLGKGGMGEVYRARDTKLGREVAVKVLRGPIPVDEAAELAKQIATALEVGHEQGIVHRDLKPANIKIDDEGTVRVLDFGLAKTASPEPGGARYSVSADGQRFLVIPDTRTVTDASMKLIMNWPLKLDRERR